MKKLLSIIFVLFGVLLLAGCGSDKLDVSKTKSDKFGELSFEVPNAFTKEEDKETLKDSSITFSDFSYEYTKMASNGKFDDMCSLSFFYTDTFPEYTVEKYANIHHQNVKGTKKTINGVEWLAFSEDFDGDGKMVDYYYYAKNGKKHYEVHYSDWGSGTECGEAMDGIINSLKFNFLYDIMKWR